MRKARTNKELVDIQDYVRKFNKEYKHELGAPEKRTSARAYQPHVNSGQYDFLLSDAARERLDEIEAQRPICVCETKMKMGPPGNTKNRPSDWDGTWYCPSCLYTELKIKRELDL